MMEESSTVRQLDVNAVIEEMMVLLRQQNTLLSSPEKFFAPVVDMLEQRNAAASRRNADRV